MNIQADPVGYKALSRHFAAASRADAEAADEMRDQGYFIRMGSYAMALLAVIAVLAVLHVSRAIAMPVVLGIVVGLILGPLGDKVARFRIPVPVTIMALVIGGLTLFSGVVYLVSPSLADFSQAGPKLARGFDRIVRSAEGMVSVFESFKSNTGTSASALITETRTSTVDIAKSVAAFLTPAVSQFMIFFFTLLLFVASRQEIRNALVMCFSDREKRLSALRSFNSAESKLTDYVLTVTGVNVVLGLIVAATFWIAGIPGALVWGVLAFIVNFLPVVGPLLLKGLLLVFGIATSTSLLGAMLPFGLYFTVSIIEANLVTPRVVGNRITMSPLMVFLSVVFWTWLWGFAGAFLAMPILAIIGVLRDEFTTSVSPKLPG